MTDLNAKLWRWFGLFLVGSLAGTCVLARTVLAGPTTFTEDWSPGWESRWEGVSPGCASASGGVLRSVCGAVRSLARFDPAYDVELTARVRGRGGYFWAGSALINQDGSNDGEGEYGQVALMRQTDPFACWLCPRRAKVVVLVSPGARGGVERGYDEWAWVDARVRWNASASRWEHWADGRQLKSVSVPRPRAALQAWIGGGAEPPYGETEFGRVTVVGVRAGG